MLNPEVKLSNSSVVGVSSNQISSGLENETIVLELQSGAYYGLNEISTRIWELLQQPVSIECLRDTVLEEYDVSADICERDLYQFLSKLLDVGLIEVKESV